MREAASLGKGEGCYDLFENIWKTVRALAESKQEYGIVVEVMVSKRTKGAQAGFRFLLVNVYFTFEAAVKGVFCVNEICLRRLYLF